MQNAEGSYKNQAIKPGIKRAIKGEILRLHIAQKDKRAREILGDLKKWVKAKYPGVKIVLPSLRSVQQTIYDWEHPRTPEEKRRNEQTEGLDQPWTIGACVNYNIPADIIPTLIEEQKRCALVNEKARQDWETERGKTLRQLGVTEPYRRMLTIRQARWFAKLYGIVSEVAKRKYPDSPEEQKDLTSRLIDQYATKEQVSEFEKLQCPDTSDLDNAYFMGGNLDSLDGRTWWSRPVYRKKLKGDKNER